MAGAAVVMVLVAVCVISPSGVSGQKLSLTIIPANGDIQLGESQLFLCKLGRGEATFHWIKPDGEQVQEDEEEYLLQTIDESSVGLTIKASSVDQNGLFRCAAESDSGDSAEQSIYIRVIQKPTFTGKEKTYSEFDEGSNAEIRCSVSGIPEPSVTWIRNGIDITKLNDARISITQEKLRIAQVRASDAGMYSCRASIESRNEVEQKTYTLSVNVPATAQSKNKSTTVMGGTNSTASLICVAKGHPQPKITWSRAGKPIRPMGGKYAFSSDASELQIQHVEKDDEGEYNCTASNKLAQYVTTMSLHVLEAQQIVQPKGMGAGGIVAIVIVILLVVLLVIDISCYYTNNCGVLRCLAVNLLGKHPHGGKGHILQDSKKTEKPSRSTVVNVSGIEA